MSWCRYLSLCLAAAALAGCTRFEPQPLVPGQTAARLESRSLADVRLKTFIEAHAVHKPVIWPLESWNEEHLLLAAFFFNPSLEVARAQWSVARGGEETAAQRPNPTLTVTPGYNATILSPSPWIPAGVLDVPLETAGKRGYRRTQAAQLSEAARLNIASVAWQVRADVRLGLIECLAARGREELLQKQLALQEQIVQRLEQQVQAGALASSEAVTYRLALERARLDWTEARRQSAEARAHLAEAIGVPMAALDGIRLEYNLEREPARARDLTSAALRRAALVSRPDILGALAEYEASQSALQLEIAKQYPDIHLQPGYQYDQGSSKWSLGIGAELPLLNQNQGAIAEAKARRAEAAARFNALQAKVLAALDRAEAVFRASEGSADSLRSMAAMQLQRSELVQALVKAGAVDQTDLLSAQLEQTVADLAQLDGQVKLHQAIAALEDAVRRPLESSDNILYSSRNP